MENIKDLMLKINFPTEAVECFDELQKTVYANEKTEVQFDDLCTIYMTDAYNVNGFVMDNLKKLAEENDFNEYSITMLLLLDCGVKLGRRYREKGLSEELYYRTMDDLRCKLLECKECEYVWGTFVGGWFHEFYVLKRIGIGRFQFDLTQLKADYVLPDGKIIPAGTPDLGMHIPSSGVPLTDDVRLGTYKMAYDFFKDRLYNDLLVIHCGSWLLYPEHRNFLPKHLNILRFMDDFDIIANAEKDGFSNDWRVYGHYSELAWEELPEDTSLRKAYKKHLLETGKSGDGFGVIVFDGEKIINKK